MRLLDSLLEIVGNLGFLVGNNDRVRARTRKEKRSWGTEYEGLAVSAAVEGGAADSFRIEVALRNAATESRQIQVSDWLNFFSLTICRPDGTEAQLTAFGRYQIEAARAAEPRKITLAPCDIVEAVIPVASLYDLRQRGVYRITGSCRATSAVSNVVEIRI